MGGEQEQSEHDADDEIKEEEWHYKLREEFINSYKQYVESQKFSVVQTAAPAPHKTTKA